MIEDVAQAIWKQSNRQLRSGEAWADAHPLAKDAFRELARAAIEAMREPTKEMIESTLDRCGYDDSFAWSVMIDAALTDKQNP